MSILNEIGNTGIELTEYNNLTEEECKQLVHESYEDSRYVVYKSDDGSDYQKNHEVASSSEWSRQHRLYTPIEINILGGLVADDVQHLTHEQVGNGRNNVIRAEFELGESEVTLHLYTTMLGVPVYPIPSLKGRYVNIDVIDGETPTCTYGTNTVTKVLKSLYTMSYKDYLLMQLDLVENTYTKEVNPNRVNMHDILKYTGKRQVYTSNDFEMTKYIDYADNECNIYSDSNKKIMLPRGSSSLEYNEGLITIEYILYSEGAMLWEQDGYIDFKGKGMRIITLELEPEGKKYKVTPHVQRTDVTHVALVTESNVTRDEIMEKYLVARYFTKPITFKQLQKLDLVQSIKNTYLNYVRNEEMIAEIRKNGDM